MRNLKRKVNKVICEECRAIIDSSWIHRIKSKYSRKGYITVCNNCLKKRGWENKPRYEASNLEEYIENTPENIITPTMIETEGNKKYLQYHHNTGYLLTRDELEFIVEELQKTLTLDNSFDEFIEEENKIKTLRNKFSVSEHNKNKFTIPLDDVRARKKKFNLDKRKWSFECGNCSDRISEEESLTFYSITPYEYLSNTGTERACSLGCVYIIVKDIITNWLNEIDYKDYFYIDNLEQQIKEYCARSIN